MRPVCGQKIPRLDLGARPQPNFLWLMPNNSIAKGGSALSSNYWVEQVWKDLAFPLAIGSHKYGRIYPPTTGLNKNELIKVYGFFLLRIIAKSYSHACRSFFTCPSRIPTTDYSSRLKEGEGQDKHKDNTEIIFFYCLHNLFTEGFPSLQLYLNLSLWFTAPSL